MSRYWFILFSGYFFGSCFGQSDSVRITPDTTPTADTALLSVQSISLNEAYMEVVDASALKISNREYLAPFFAQLSALESGKSKKVHITHIGDSHIQADFLTGQMRQHFQRDFGNGGRGLIFPYKLARTNGPLDFAITSDVNWKAKRNVFPQRPMDIGISGITIGTEKGLYHLQIRIDSNDAMDSLVIFHKGPETNPFQVYQTQDNHLVAKHSTVTKTTYHKIRPGESLSVIARKYGVTSNQLMRWNGLKSSRIYAGKSLKILSTVKEPRPIRADEMQPLDGNSTYQPAQFGFGLDQPHYQAVLKYQGPANHEINGIYIEKNAPGVVYNMIGVNGAKYEHYNLSKNFQPQFRELPHDLIIVALGTNESLESQYDPIRLEEEFARFIGDLKKYNPEAAFIISLNPDAYSRRRQNPNAKRLHDIFRQLCEDQGLAYFDAFQLMGGQGGMYQWYKKGLANRDLVHLNRAGYQFMADLLYTAIMDAYLEYRADVGID